MAGGAALAITTQVALTNAALVARNSEAARKKAGEEVETERDDQVPEEFAESK